MLTRLLVMACACSLLLPAGEAPAAAAGAAPWEPSFTTQVRGKDRQFVVFKGSTFILVAADELGSGLGDGQDVALTGKLRKLPGGKLGLYRVDNLVIEGAGEALAGKLDGDNLYLLGGIALKGQARSMTVRHTAIAPSDARLLQDRLAGIAEDDWDRRLGAVSWCRDQARSAGNADFWSATADSLLTAVVEDLAKKSADRKDLALSIRALDLALNQLRDHGLAARVCSPAWIREHGGPQAEQLARRMRGLGYSLYKDQWLPRTQALEREYEDRFGALAWKDADGFYKLGRWADENAELLPRSRERSWRCYQAGFSADPSHEGIARELGVQPQSRTAGSSAAAGGSVPAADFIDLESGLRVAAPAGWRRGQPIGGATTWNDPGSETASISVRVVRPPVDQEAQWNVLLEEARGRPGFIELGMTEEDRGERHLRAFRSTWVEGEQQRFTAVILVTLGEQAPAATLEARGLPSEQGPLDAALSACIDGTGHQPPTAAP